jgi:hypothetical protein
MLKKIIIDSLESVLNLEPLFAKPLAIHDLEEIQLESF